jgi:hypothetical protein
MKGIDMMAGQCSCGFTELADESITDHLLQVFTPDDAIGRDGKRHEETEGLACLCGLTAATTGELDEHFLEVFTPDAAIASDGKQHKAIGAQE